MPELVMAGEAMKAAIAVLEPAMQASGTERQMLGKVVLATVEGDIHEIPAVAVLVYSVVGNFFRTGIDRRVVVITVAGGHGKSVTVIVQD